MESRPAAQYIIFRVCFIIILLALPIFRCMTNGRTQTMHSRGRIINCGAHLSNIDTSARPIYLMRNHQYLFPILSLPRKIQKSLPEKAPFRFYIKHPRALNETKNNTPEARRQINWSRL